MRLSVDSVIYFYMFICIALLVFNVAYIFRSRGHWKSQRKKIEKWENFLLTDRGTIRAAHARRSGLEKKLVKIDELMAFHSALEPHLEEVQRYLDRNYDMFLVLAVEYRKRPAMERAFFAHLIAVYHPDRGRRNDRLSEILLQFLDNSTVYCRENVLRALYAMGNAGAVEHALMLMQANGWYHNEKLLSDGLTSFAGDREALVRRLWKARSGWDEQLQTAVVQFATNVSDSMASDFLEALNRRETPEETRFALVRYFQRHRYEEARPALLEMAGRADEGGLAIAACAALSKYPGDDTMSVLKQALHSRNWHVRRNAAASLVLLGVSDEDKEELYGSGDRYAGEMLAYMARLRERREAKA